MATAFTALVQAEQAAVAAKEASKKVHARLYGWGTDV